MEQFTADQLEREEIRNTAVFVRPRMFRDVLKSSQPDLFKKQPALTKVLHRQMMLLFSSIEGQRDEMSLEQRLECGDSFGDSNL